MLDITRKLLNKCLSYLSCVSVDAVDVCSFVPFSEALPLAKGYKVSGK